MSDAGTDTLTIRLEDEASDAANAAATALDRLAKSQDDQAKAGIGGAGERQSTAFARLREMGTKAGSALAAAMAGVQVQMGGAVTATNRLSSALQLAMNRAKEMRASDARQLGEDMARANRLPTALQSSPQAIDWDKALADASGQAGSAQRAAATDALSFAAAAAVAATAGRQLASVYSLVAQRSAQAGAADARQLGEDMARANRLPTALQSSPQAIDWDKALADASGKSGSAIKAAATGALALAANTAKSVTAAQKLASVYELVAKRAASAAKAEDKSFGERVQRSNMIPTALKQAGPGQASGFQQALGWSSKLVGPKITGALVGGASKLSAAWDKAGPAGQAIIKAGGSLLAGGASIAMGAVALAAAVAMLAAAAVGKVLSGVASASITATDRKTKAVSSLGKDGGELYQTAVKLAVDLDLDLDQTIRETKGLITTGFAKKQIPVIIEAVADFRIIKGDDGANALQKSLEKTRALGRFNQESVDSLGEAGVRTELVYKALAKSMGAPLDIVKAKVKAGQVDVEKGIAAILDAAKQQGGGAAKAASNTVGGLLGGLKIQASTLFDEVDTGPLKEAMSTLSTIFAGPAGKQLKSSLTGLGTQLFKTLFGPFQGPEGQQKLEAFITRVGEVAVSLAAILKDAAPLVQSFVDITLALAGGAGDKTDNPAAQIITAIADAARAALHPIDLIWSVMAKIANYGASLTGGAPVFDPSKLGGIAEMAPSALSGGQLAGQNLASGFASGIVSGAGAAVTAAIAMVKATLTGVATAQDAHSPSRKFGMQGKYAVQGYVGEISRGAGAANDAGARLATGAIGGTADKQAAMTVGALTPAGGGQQSHGPVTFNVVASGGTPEENKRSGEEIGEASYAQWSAHFGRKMRDTARKAG